VSEAPLLPVVPGPTRLVSSVLRDSGPSYSVAVLDLTRELASKLLDAMNRVGACRGTLADRTNPPFSIQLTPEAEAAFDRRILDWGVADPGDVQRDFGPLPADVTAGYMDVAWECQGSVHERTYWLEIVRVVDYLAGKADAFPRLRKEGK
jgi:hypothetical protein